MSRLLILDHQDVETLLPIRECVDVMEEAFALLARGEGFQPLRVLFRTDQTPGFLGLMPAWRGGSSPVWSLKEVCVFPQNPSRGLDTHLGAVLLHSGETGELLAVANASAITAIRTGAVSALATRVLARPDATRLALIGTGAQARAHLGAMAVVRDLSVVRVAGHSRRQAEEFVVEMQSQVPVPLEAVSSAEEAVRNADLIVTATSSRTPVLDRSWIPAGAHLNLVGSSTREAREADGATMAAGRLYVDRRESTVNESGDYRLALEEGSIGPDHIVAELGEVILDPARGRRDRDEITIFESLGLAMEDLAAIAFLHEKATRLGAGQWVEL